MRRFLVVLLAISVSCSSQAEVAPDATLSPGAIVDGSVDLFGETLEAERGRPVVVNFWATWCEPCKTEMPRLVEAARAYEDEVSFLGINVEDDQASAEAFAARVGIPFPSLADSRGRIRNAEGVLGLPVTQFYRADGELAFVHNGEIDEQTLTERLEEIVRLSVPPSARDR